MTKKLIIFGLSNIAECAFEYFTHDSDYDVVAFTLDKAYLESEGQVHFGLPVVAFEDLETCFPPEEFDIFVAVGSKNLNRLRKTKVKQAKEKGYSLASYISSKATIWPNVKLGQHVFIQEGNNLQPFVEIGDNVTLWAGNHVGHASVIENHCFITSQVVISGHCRIGKNCFVGVNACLADNISVGKDSFIGMGAIITQDTEENSLFAASKTHVSKIPAKRFCRVKDD